MGKCLLSPLFLKFIKFSKECFHTTVHDMFVLNYSAAHSNRLTHVSVPFSSIKTAHICFIRFVVVLVTNAIIIVFVIYSFLHNTVSCVTSHV